MSEVGLFYRTRRSSQLDSSILLVRQAIQCDSTFFAAHANLISFLSLKGEYDEAIQVVDKLLSWSGNVPGTIVLKGAILEKQGKTQLAEEQYNLAYQIYSQQLANDPDNLDIIGQKMYLTAYIEGKETAIHEIDQYIIKYPDNDLLKQYREILTKFRKSDFSSAIGPLK